MKELLGMELGLILDLTKYPQNISEEGAKDFFGLNVTLYDQPNSFSR